MNKRVTVLLGDPDKYCSIVADRFLISTLVENHELRVYRSGAAPGGEDDVMVGWFSEGSYKAVYVTEQNGDKRG